MSPDIQRTNLDNGLQILSIPLPHLHTATLAVFVKVGSRFESPADNGLSHFVEHMLFRGTDAHPTSWDLNFAIERLGGTLHAETGRDLSLFHMSVEPALLDAAMALFGELFGRPRFSDIERERRIILEEINEDYSEDGVEINGDDIVRGLMFGAHPLGQRVIGPRDNVRRFGEEDVRRHFAHYYCAGNMLLCAAGPLRSEDVVVSARRHLGGLPRGGPAVAAAPTFDQSGARYRHVRDSGSQTSIHVLFRAVPDMDPGYAASMALLRALDDGMATPLHYQLCDQQGLAYSVQASIEPLADVALLEVVGATSQAKVPDLLRGMLELPGRLRHERISDAELDKVKLRYRHDLLSALDDSHAVAGWFGGSALYYAPPSFEERIAQMEAVTSEDIRTTAERILRPERLAVVVVGPLSRSRRDQVRELVTRWR